MSTKIDDDFVFVGTASELGRVFPGPDVNLGDDALVLLVAEGATHEQRIEMAQKAAEIRAAHAS